MLPWQRRCYWQGYHGCGLEGVQTSGAASPRMFLSKLRLHGVSVEPLVTPSRTNEFGSPRFVMCSVLLRSIAAKSRSRMHRVSRHGNAACHKYHLRPLVLDLPDSTLW